MTGFIAPEFDDVAHPGLPAPLPEGERIIWQGRPEIGAVARYIVKTRWIAAYFGIMLAWLVVTGFYFERSAVDIMMSLIIMAAAGAIVVGLFYLYAVGVRRTTIYTITTRRIIMRIGVALPTAYNLPFGEIESVDARERAGGIGDISLRFLPDVRLSWLLFWPHVRGFRMRRTEPQMICINDVEHVAGLLSMQLHADLARRQPQTVGLDVIEEPDNGGAMMPFPQAAE